ncbi:MAG: endonuclease MutS2 [Clostridia bacterium]|nr:endonuclease MutS2 [Clostridia bacterium]
MDRVLKALEYDKILNILVSYAQSDKGKELISSFRPTSDLNKCRALLDETKEAYKLEYVLNVFPSFSVDDVTESVRHAEKLSVLSIPELMKIATVLRVSSEAKSALTKKRSEAPILAGYADSVYTADILAEEIDRSILNDEELSDYASPDLASIRADIRRSNERLKEKLYSYVNNKNVSKYLQDNIVTQRGDRYVIPVRNEYRGMVKGIVHDTSSSGQTVFIEPADIVEMNNKIRQLKIDESREVEKILRAFTAKIGSISNQILTNAEVLAALDAIFARATFSERFDCNPPILNDKGYIHIINGRHPLIEKSKVVPVSVTIGDNYDLLLITGPNTGGKTVSLKLTGLLTLLAMSGLFVPASSGSELSVFEKVFCDVGDEQSIEQSLSTFSSHIKNVVEIVNGADKNSLVLLDEVGAGTDPEQGAALAVAITDYLRRTGAKCVITTHYSQLKEYSYATERVENASMDFNPETFEPTYKLIIGVPGTSNALEISKRLGLKSEIIEDAASQIKRETKNFEEVLQSADQARRIHEDKVKEVEDLQAELKEEIRLAKLKQTKLDNELEKLNLAAKREVKRLVENAMSEVNEIVEELKELVKEPTPQSYFEATKLRKKLESVTAKEEAEEKEKPKFTDEPCKAGDRVYVTNLDQKGVLDSIKANGDYVVKLGRMTVTLKEKFVKKLFEQKPEEKEEEKKKAVKYTSHVQGGYQSELNIIGKRALDAIAQVEAFIADSKEHNMEFVRIIHGNGTGALRAAVWEFLDGADVVSFRLGKKDEGGTGATIVRLR